MKERKVLLVAYYYPPVNASGTFRTTSFVAHLSRLGWKPTVLTVKRGEEAEDEALNSRVPESVRVIRAGKIALPLDRLRGQKTNEKGGPSGESGGQSSPESDYPYPKTWPGRLKDFASWFLRFPDRKVGWMLPSLFAGMRYLLSNRTDLIYSSGPPHTGHLVATLLSRFSGIPLVLDFRDPWFGNPFNTLPYPALSRLEAFLESFVVRSARKVVCVTEEHRDQLCQRYYAGTMPDRFVVITNGYDRETFPEVAEKPKGERMEILHAGLLYGKRTPFPFLQAIAGICEENPGLERRLLVSLLGPTSGASFSTEKLREAVRVPDVLSLEGSVPHQEALSRMVAADVLLLLGPSGEPEVQVPAKLYEYLGCGRPLLVLSHPQGAIARILKSCSGFGYHCPVDDIPAIKAAILRLFEDWEQQAPGSGTKRREPPPAFDRALLAESLAKNFDLACLPRSTFGREYSIG